MTPRRRAKDDVLSLLGLSRNKPPLPSITRREIRKAWRMLPPKDRALLALLYGRGASVRELAGLLGLAPVTVRRMARRAVRRATDPQHLAILAAWQRLRPEERQLACLHCFLGVSVERIAALGLVRVGSATGRTAGPAHVKALRTMLRRIRRKARRWGRPERFQEELDSSSPPADPDASAG